MKRIISSIALALILPCQAGATHFVSLGIADSETLMLCFRDGEVRYRDDGSGPSAYLGHTFVEGDDTLTVFHPRFNPVASGWTVSSGDDGSFGTVSISRIMRRSKPMATDHPRGREGAPGTHPGQTPFNGTEVWSAGNGGDARIILSYCYPDWYGGGWPRQESFFNQRYFWVNGEFSPRETMRGKMALLAYLYGIRP